MAGIFSDQTLQAMLQALVNTALFPAGDVKLCLYTNAYTPTVTMTPGSFTEPTDPSYARITLSSGDWTIGTTATGANGVMTQKTFTFSTSASIEGWFLLDSINGKVFSAEKMTSPVTVPGSGGPVLADVTLVLDTP